MIQQCDTESMKLKLNKDGLRAALIRCGHFIRVKKHQEDRPRTNRVNNPVEQAWVEEQ